MNAITVPTPRIRSQTRRRKVSGWLLATMFVCVLVAIPLISVIYLAFGNNEGIWSHLASTVLPGYLKTTALLVIGVGSGTYLIGVSTAWLVTMCRFPGKRYFEWALLLPLAMPAYIVAFVYTDILEYAGPVQSALRELFGWESKRDYWFPEIRSLGGAIMMMTLTLYPYVFLLTRAAFVEQNVSAIEASRTLGNGPWRSFFNVSLPLARPASVVGVALVLMEALNDFGTVDFFAVQTFTAAIYDVWLNMNSVAGAAQLSVVMLLFVLALIILERWGRSKKGYQQSTDQYQELPEFALTGARAALATIACLLPVLLGFIVPALVLVNYATKHYQATLEADFLAILSNSMQLSGLAAVIALTVGLGLASAARLSRMDGLKILNRFAAIGYAVPGAVLAIGILVPLGAFDNAVDGVMNHHFGISTGLIFSGTLVAVTYGYVVRFLALSYGASEASLAKIKPSMEDAARSMGTGKFNTVRRVHFPMVRASLIAATLLVFVDCMKELPMTIILRPFNFETLATFVFQYASDELLEEASLAALTIVGVGVIPVVLLTIGIRVARPGYRPEPTR